MGSISFSAVVVMYNEARRLPGRLASLKPCKQIIAIDLGSADDSRAIAEKYGAMVVTHPRTKIVERIRHIGYPMADHDWIFIVDPDEVVEPETCALATEAIERNPSLAAIRLPMQNYFMGKPLATTIWSHGLKGPGIINRNRIRPVIHVHDDSHALPDCDTIILASLKPLHGRAAGEAGFLPRFICGM